MSKNSTAYQDIAPTLYQPLPWGATTRILEVLPGDGELNLLLTVIDLNDTSPFDALSYTWGNQSSFKTVRINGISVPVTQNLQDALLSIRQCQDTQRIWVDALCINQANLAERSAQIPRLLRIYQTARRVLVWLGLEDKSTGLALKHAKLLLERPSGFTDTSEKIDFVKAGENALRSLFERSWFRRIWVIQEVSVSRQALVCIGTTRVSWQLLLTAAKHLERIHKITYHALFDDVKDYQSGNRVKMLPMAILHQDFEASDPKDKLYALLGLVTDQDHGMISADYNKDVRVVYQEFAVKCLDSYHNLDIFAGASQKRIADLPSWVPDWSQPRTSCGFSLGHHSASWAPEFKASGESFADYHLPKDGDRLHLRGHKFSTVERCTASMAGLDFTVPFRLGFGPSADWIINRTRRIAFYLECEDLAGLRRQDTTYPTNEPISDVYWQVISGGCRPEIWNKVQTEFGEWDNAMRTFSFLHKLRGVDNRKLLFVMMTGFLARRTVFYKFPSLRVSHIPTSEEPWTFLNKHMFMEGRVMMKTSDRYLGLVPIAAERGDEIWLLQGGKVPVVLRPSKGGKVYELLGEAYVHGIMYGEGFSLNKCITIPIV